MNLYGFVGNDGIGRWDLLGNWTEIERKGGTWASVCSDKDYDTWDTLARKTRLETFEADKWVLGYDGPWPTKGKAYKLSKIVALACGADEMGWKMHLSSKGLFMGFKGFLNPAGIAV